MSLEAFIEEAIRRAVREEIAPLRELIAAREPLRAVGPMALPKLLTMREAARQLSCSRTKLKQLVREGKVATTVLGRRRMIPLSEVERNSKPQASAPRPDRQPKQALSPAEEAAALKAAIRRSR